MNRFNRTKSESREAAIAARRNETTNTRNRRPVCQRHESVIVIDRCEAAYRLNPWLKDLRPMT